MEPRCESRSLAAVSRCENRRASFEDKLFDAITTELGRLLAEAGSISFAGWSVWEVESTE